MVTRRGIVSVVRYCSEMARMVVGCRLFVLLMLTQSAVGGGYSSIKTKNMCKDASMFKHWKTLYKECRYACKRLQNYLCAPCTACRDRGRACGRLFDQLIGNSVGCGGNCAQGNADV